MLPTISQRPWFALRSLRSNILTAPATVTSTILLTFLFTGFYSASRAQPAVDDLVKQSKTDSIRQNVSAYRHIYPEFLPDPKITFRNEIREKLERNDMIARRTQIDIPEFYVGTL